MKLLYKAGWVTVANLILCFTSCKKTLDPNTPGNLVPLTVTEDPTIPSITIIGTRLHAETFGNPANPMLVILHGGPGNDYRSMLHCKACAADGYFVIFFDQRGCGLSQRHEKKVYTLPLLLDDLSAVIAYYRQSPQQKVILIGHSWGAMLATAYINQYPSAVQGLVLAEPGGFAWNQTKDYINKTRELDPLGEQSNDAFYFEQFLSGNHNDHAVQDYNRAIAATVFNGVDNIEGNAGPFPFWRMGAVMNAACIEIAERDGFDWRAHLQQFNPKVLFCYSEKNRANGSEHAQLLAAAYPRVQVEQVRGSGHELFYFGWEQVYPLIKTYLHALK